MLKPYLDYQLAEETECWITVYEFHSADGFVPDWAPIKNWVDFRIKRGCRPTDTFLRARTTTTLPGQSQYEAYLEEDYPLRAYGPFSFEDAVDELLQFAERIPAYPMAEVNLSFAYRDPDTQYHTLQGAVPVREFITDRRSGSCLLLFPPAMDLIQTMLLGLLASPDNKETTCAGVHQRVAFYCGVRFHAHLVRATARDLVSSGRIVYAPAVVGQEAQCLIV